MSQTVKRTLIFSLIFSFLFFELTLPVARAEMIASETAFTMASEQANRDRLLSLLDRQDVRQGLERHGVDPLEARERVAALSTEELRQIAPFIDQLPAGGDGIGAMVAGVVLIFVILLITDIAGLTHVFSFVNHHR